MEIIKWDSSLEGPIPAFNDEHKYLIKVINDTYNLMREGKRDEAKKYLVEKVVSYTDKHFRHEEEVLEKYGFPKDKLEGHKKMHRFFVKHIVDELVPKIEKGGEAEFRDALNFIVSWLIMHIKNMDVNGYGKWFKENNIPIPEDKMVDI